MNKRPDHRIPDGAAQRLNVYWGGVTAGAATAVYAPVVVGGVIVAPEATAATARAAKQVCESPEARDTAFRVCIAMGVCSKDKPDSWVDDVQRKFEIREGLMRESQQTGGVTFPRP